MKPPIRLVAIVGSLRADSVNRILFDSAAKLVPPEVELSEVSLRDVPLYDGDVEAAGDPAAVTVLKEQVDAADGLVIFTPEYNRGTPAVVKNAIDWLSRVPGDSVLSRTTVGVVASTPGRHDVSGVRSHLADSLTSTAEAYFERSLAIASVTRKLDDDRLADDETCRVLSAWLAEFIEYVEAMADDG